MTEHPSGRKEDHQKKEVVVSNKPAPEKKEGLFAYFKSSWTEFKKVVWPSRDEAVKMTVFVIIFVAVLAPSFMRQIQLFHGCFLMFY